MTVLQKQHPALPSWASAHEGRVRDKTLKSVIRLFNVDYSWLLVARLTPFLILSSFSFAFSSSSAILFFSQVSLYSAPCLELLFVYLSLNWWQYIISSSLQTKYLLRLSLSVRWFGPAPPKTHKESCIRNRTAVASKYPKTHTLLSSNSHLSYFFLPNLLLEINLPSKELLPIFIF